MVKPATLKKILLIFTVAFLLNITIETIVMVFYGVGFGLLDILKAFIFLPITVFQGVTVDNLLFDKSFRFFSYISMAFYPVIFILLIFGKKLISHANNYIYFIIGGFFLLSYIAPIHRIWAILSV